MSHIRHYRVFPWGNGNITFAGECRNVSVRLVKGLYEPYQALPSVSMGQREHYLHWRVSQKYQTGWSKVLHLSWS